MTKEQVFKMDFLEIKNRFLELKKISTDCYGCTRCTDCYGCYDCKDCTRCDDCYDCTDCMFCKGLIDKKYCILNIQFTEEEYFKKVDELKKEGYL